MTIEELLAKQLEVIDSFKSSFKPLYLAVADVRGEMTFRIFGSGRGSGKNASGSDLSSVPYSTDEIWIDPRASPRKVSGRNIGKRGTEIESYYYPDGQGYNSFKSDIDRGQLRLSNNLFQAFSNEAGDNPIQEQGENAVIAIDESESGKIQGLEKKYGVIFEMTQEEEDAFALILSDYITEAINNGIE